VHRYEATISWSRNGARFTDNRYPRAHEWRFDGGAVVPASSSPQVVPVPLSSEAAVDPEEALVAAASSCHMLWFLSIAARRGFVVEHYRDHPVGVMEPDRAGKLAFTRITLRPRIEFNEESCPAPDELRAIHDAAGEECYIARSLKAEIVIEE